MSGVLARFHALAIATHANRLASIVDRRAPVGVAARDCPRPVGGLVDAPRK